MDHSLFPWLKRLFAACALAVLLLVVVFLAAVGPWIRDDMRLDWIVRAVALDWRDQGEQAARTRLQYELDHQGIGIWVADEDCEFRDEPPLRTVQCRWTATLHVPTTARSIPLPFESVAVVTANGDIQ